MTINGKKKTPEDLWKWITSAPKDFYFIRKKMYAKGEMGIKDNRVEK